ncbi:MAG: aspartate kinase [Deltaproteobacteria bacterium]|nr:aspartate kinase [Deltaproteobacteria bacterium]
MSATVPPAVVMKFGGSSVADVAKIKRVAALVKRRSDQGVGVVVVVSAMGKTTDGLIAQAREVSAEPNRRELDMLLTVGERASAALTTMALLDLGVPALSLTGSQAGIVTSATHAGARVLEVRPYRVQDALAEGRVVVLAGFQGVSYAREITTLGRGGSDTTAVAMAAALDATCEIYSDVDGVWSSDPRVVPDTVKLEALSYEEMQELAEAGAKVLNAQAVQFAKAKGIAIYALQTPHDGAQGSGTVVRKDAPLPVGGVRGVAHRTTLHRLVGRRKDALAAMLAFLDMHHLPSGQIVALDERVEILVPPEDAHGFDGACASLATDAVFGRGDDVGAVSLVGQGILEDRRVLAQALALLEQHGVGVLGVSTSSFRVSFLVPAGPLAEEVARLLHGRFVAAGRMETPKGPSGE